MSSLRARRIARNPFAFPGGYAPAFNPAHPASQKVRVSGVALSNSYIDLLTGRIGTPSSSTATIDSSIGPAVGFASTQLVTIPGTFPAAADTSGTLACFFRKVTAPASTCVFVASSNSSAGVDFNTGSTTVNVLGITFRGLASVSSGITIATSAVYFMAVSYNTSVANFVVTDMSTGIVTTASAANASSASASNGTVCVGNRSAAGNPACGNISHFMVSGNYMSLPQLAQWGADPFSFWYPK